MPELNQVVSILANVAQALAVIVAVWSLSSSRKEAKASRDLDVALNLSESFRTRWESGWAECLEAVGADHRNGRPGDLPPEHVKQLRHMLNWVDWLGTMLKNHCLANEQVIFDSIQIPIRRIINAGQPLVEQDVQEFGFDYWASLFVVANRLNVEWVSDLQRRTTDHGLAAMDRRSRVQQLLPLSITSMAPRPGARG
jgi:hypothetical protein